MSGISDAVVRIVAGAVGAAVEAVATRLAARKRRPTLDPPIDKLSVEDEVARARAEREARKRDGTKTDGG